MGGAEVRARLGGPAALPASLLLQQGGEAMQNQGLRFAYVEGPPPYTRQSKLRQSKPRQSKLRQSKLRRPPPARAPKRKNN